MEIDPNDAGFHCAYAVFHTDYDRMWALIEANGHFGRALDLVPWGVAIRGEYNRFLEKAVDRPDWRETGERNSPRRAYRTARRGDYDRSHPYRETQAAR